MRTIYSYKQVKRKLTFVLNRIMEQNHLNFSTTNSFKVWNDYSYGKFYLDKVGRNYDMSLEGLIHHILFKEKLYYKILPRHQYNAIKTIVKDYSDCIYSPSIEFFSNEEEFLFIEQLCIGIIDFGISYVYSGLSKRGFDVSSIFEEYDSFDEKSFINFLT